MSEASHTLEDGKVHVYRRDNSRFWQCAVFVGGHNHRQSTRQTNLAAAFDFAKSWYVERLTDERLRSRGINPDTMRPANEDQPAPSNRPKRTRRKAKPDEITFAHAVEAFKKEYRVITQGERNEEYVNGKFAQLDRHLIPFFGKRPITEITAGLIQEYRVHRLTPPKAEPELEKPRKWKWKRGEKRPARRAWKRPARATMHSEMVALRQVLKTANRKGWIAGLPDMSAPYKTSGKVETRAWFSPEQYKRFLDAVRDRAKNPRNERWRPECEQFLDFVLIMANTGLRPDEAARLQYKHVSIAVDEATGERILEIEVRRGKRGVGYCKSMPGAVFPFTRMRKRNNPKETDLVFGPVQRELLNAILTELDMKVDDQGKARTAYSLRHTYICFRLMEGADIYQLAKNCRTSVEMIEKFYASHLKDMLDAGAINVRKAKPRKVASAKRP